MVLLLLLTVQGAGAMEVPDPVDPDSNISEPATIHESGIYNVTNDIESEDHVTAIYINGSDVVLNLKGYNVTRNSSAMFGIVVHDTSNVSIHGYGGGVENFDGDVDGHDRVGIGITETTDTLVSNGHVRNNTKGITVYDGSQNVTVQENEIVNNEIGIEIDDGSDVSNVETLDEDNTFLHNTQDVVTADDYHDVTFSVTDETDTALEGAKVHLDGFDPKFTDEDGTAHFSAENGTYNYTVSKDGYAARNGSVEVDGANVTELVTLKAEHRLTVDVDDEDGNSLENVDIQLDEMVGKDREMVGQNQTDADGTAVFWVVNGTYEYHVSKDGFASRTDTVEIVGEDKTVGVTLPEGFSITIELQDEGGTPVENVDVALREDQDPVGHTQTDESGQAIFRVEPGTYHYDTFSDEYVTRTGSVTIVDDNVTVERVLQPVDHTITFVVEDEDGEPLVHDQDGAHVNLYSADSNVRYLNPDENGTVEAGVVDETVYTFVAAADGKLRVGDRIEIDGEDVTRTVALREPDPTSFEGYTLSPDASTLAGVNVTVEAFNETTWHDGDDPTRVGSATSNESGYFNITDMPETLGGDPITIYTVNMTKWNGEVLEYKSEIYLRTLDSHSFAQLEGQEYVLSEAVTFNIESETHEFEYTVLDSRTEQPLASHHVVEEDDFVSDFSFHGIAEREFLFDFGKEDSPLHVKKYVENVTNHDGWNEDTRELNLTIDLTEELRWVSGHV